MRKTFDGLRNGGGNAGDPLMEGSPTSAAADDIEAPASPPSGLRAHRRRRRQRGEMEEAHHASEDKDGDDIDDTRPLVRSPGAKDVTTPTARRESSSNPSHPLETEQEEDPLSGSGHSGRPEDSPMGCEAPRNKMSLASRMGRHPGRVNLNKQAEDLTEQDERSLLNEDENSTSDSEDDEGGDYNLADRVTHGGITLTSMVEHKVREMGYMRKPPTAQLKSRRALWERVAAENVPEVHFIGELLGGQKFGPGISCKFRIEAGKHWTFLAGNRRGQTQVVYGEEDSLVPWNHPLDAHFTTRSIQGWPRVSVQVWKLDYHGRNMLLGCGFAHLPTAMGESEVKIHCWRPKGSLQEELASFFLGIMPQLKDEDVLFSKAWDQRYRLVTKPSGTVTLRCNVISRNMH